MQPWQIERRSASDKQARTRFGTRKTCADSLPFRLLRRARLYRAGGGRCQLAELINRPPPEYTRKSENISICNGCGEMLQASNEVCLKIAENIHQQFCTRSPEIPSKNGT